jgi:epoxyqueuosine reductase
MELDMFAAAVEPYAARVGVTDLAPFGEVRDAIEERIARGYRGRLGFTYRDPIRATTPASSFPWGRSIIVVAVPYLADGDGIDGTQASDGDARTVARFADGDRYSLVRAVVGRIEGLLAREGWRSEVVIDDDRLVDRAVAVRAGIAWWGKSTMALAPGLGPWFLIGSVVTDAPIAPGEEMIRDCGTCDACIPACPTDAIVAPGVLDARRCLAAIFQGRGSIPRDVRIAVGGRVYGCDACLVACPPGHRALAVVDAARAIHPREILTMADDEILETFGHWYIPGRKARFVRRNALVALGNVGDASDVAIVGAHIASGDPLIREHAAWALGRLGGRTAQAILRDALEGERDPSIRDEMLAALQP